MVPGSFGNFKSALIPFLQPSPLFSPPLLCSAVAGAGESLPGHVLCCAGAHASSCCASTALGCALEPPLQCHAAQSRRMVATSPSPWPGQGRGRRPPLARARALLKPQSPIPHVLLLSPRSHAPERAAATHRTPASLTPPSTRFTAASPPTLSTPPAPLHPRAASKLLPVDQIPLETPRPRAPPP